VILRRKEAFRVKKFKMKMVFVALFGKSEYKLLKLTDGQFEKAKGQRPRAKGRSKTKGQRTKW